VFRIFFNGPLGCLFFSFLWLSRRVLLHRIDGFLSLLYLRDSVKTSSFFPSLPHPLPSRLVYIVKIFTLFFDKTSEPSAVDPEFPSILGVRHPSPPFFNLSSSTKTVTEPESPSCRNRLRRTPPLRVFLRTFSFSSLGQRTPSSAV